MTETITPADARYADVRHTYTAHGAPAVVTVPSSGAEVRDAVQLAATARLPLAIRSGGQGPSTNDGGIVIDLERMRSVEILDERRGVVRVEAGARWGEVAASLDESRLVITSGDYGDVGVGGLAVTGGIGLLARRQGLALDRMRAAEVVLADGRLVRTDATHHPDLFWGIRGAGGALGAVVAFEFGAERIEEVVSASYTYRPADLAQLLEGWACVVENSPRAITSFLYVDGRDEVGDPVVRATVLYAGADSPEARRALLPFVLLAPKVEQRIEPTSYATLMTAPRAEHRAQAAGFVSTEGLLDHITPMSAQAMVSLVQSGSALILQIRSIGGAVNDVAPDATAFAHRGQNFSVVAGTMRDRRADMEAMWAAGIAPRVRGGYLNLSSERDEAAVRRAYPPATLARLRRLKRIYDPANLFDSNSPLPAGDRDATMGPCSQRSSQISTSASAAALT